MKDLGLYIHIPFCEKKCFYCDFTSFPDKTSEVSQYIEYLLKELSLYKAKLKGKYIISSIFIGGGTPSSISEDYIKQILDYIFNNFNTRVDIEVSIEVNPGSVTIEKLKKYKDSGINRVSIGLQSLNDNLLKSLGRIHNAVDFYDSFKMIKDVGFENINIDLMFALPDQSLKDLMLTLEEVVNLDVKHISLYSLIIEEGTVFYKLYEVGKLNIPSEDLDREMYHKSVEYLKSKGYEHYEISNFSKKGYKCKQNINYWIVNPYLGVGINSHSNLENKRFSNVSDFKNYYSKIDRAEFPIYDIEDININMEIKEYIILGLRLIDGINKADFKKRFNEDIDQLYKEQILKNIENGLLSSTETHIKLTENGLDLCNQVELDFFL